MGTVLAADPRVTKIWLCMRPAAGRSSVGWQRACGHCLGLCCPRRSARRCSAEAVPDVRGRRSLQHETDPPPRAHSQRATVRSAACQPRTTEGQGQLQPHLFTRLSTSRHAYQPSAPSAVAVEEPVPAPPESSPWTCDLRPPSDRSAPSASAPVFACPDAPFPSFDFLLRARGPPTNAKGRERASSLLLAVAERHPHERLTRPGL